MKTREFPLRLLTAALVALLTALALRLAFAPTVAVAAEPFRGRIEAGEPPRFTDADEQALADARAKLVENQRKLLTGTITKDEAARLAAEAAPHAARVRYLQEKRRLWQQHVEERRGGSDPGMMVAGTAETGEIVMSPEEREKLYGLLLTYRGLYLDLWNLEGRPGAPRRPRPSGDQWLVLARDLAPFAQARFSTGPGGNARYVLRAALVRDQCYLHASVEYFKAGNRTDFAKYHAKGINGLDTLVSGRVAGTEGVRPFEEHQLLPAASAPYSFAELAGSEDRSTWPAVSQMRTVDKAKQVLAEFCPWGVRMYYCLEEAGFLEGLDWEILTPFQGNESKVLWEKSLKVIPSSILKDFDGFAAGRFEHRGRTLQFPWKLAPAPPTCTMWFVSPTVVRLTLGEMLDWAGDISSLLPAKMAGARFLKAAKELILDKLLDQALMLAAGDYDDSTAIFTSTGTLGDDGSVDPLVESFQVRQDASQIAQMYKDAYQGIIDAVEAGEKRLIFESIDPADAALAEEIGRPTTYDGGMWPPVMVRADAIGWEDTGDIRFLRQWRYLRYYQLDPRAIAGTAKYDLSTTPVDTLAYSVQFVNNTPVAPEPLIIAVAARSPSVQFVNNAPAPPGPAWRLLPPKPLGARLYLTDFAPNLQVIRITVAEPTLAKWQKDLKPDEAVIAVLKGPVPKAPDFVMGEAMRSASGPTFVLGLLHPRVKAPSPIMEVASRLSCETPPDLFTRYEVRVYRCKKVNADATLRSYNPNAPIVGARGAINAVYRYQENSAVELAKFPVRFFSKAADKATGKLSFELEGKSPRGLHVLSQDYGEAPAPVLDLTASNDPVLPRGLELGVITYPEKGVLKLEKHVGDFELRAFLAPVEPGVHHATVRIGSTTYHLWAKTTTRAGAAIFKARIPAPAGRQTVTVTAEGAPPQTFILDRPRPVVSFNSVNSQLKEAQRVVGLARDARAAWRATLSLKSAEHSVALTYLSDGQYAKAIELCRGVDQWLARSGQSSDVRETAHWLLLREDVYKTLVSAAWYAADAGTMAQFAPSFIEALTARIDYANAHEREVYSGIAPNKVAWMVGVDCQSTIGRALTAGVPPAAMTKLLGVYRALRQREGANEIERDVDRFDFREARR